MDRRKKLAQDHSNKKTQFLFEWDEKEDTSQ